MTPLAPVANLNVTEASKLDTWQVIANFIVFQIAWLSCVEAVAHDAALLGLLAIAAAIGICIFTAGNKQQAIKLIAFSVSMGALLELVLLAIHATQFNDSLLITTSIRFPPLWMIGLWGLFATTLNVSLRWLRGRYLLAAVLGVIAGPLSYWAGSGIGALMLPNRYSLMMIGICWALAMPALLVAAKRWNAFQ